MSHQASAELCVALIFMDPGDQTRTAGSAGEATPFFLCLLSRVCERQSATPQWEREIQLSAFQKEESDHPSDKVLRPLSRADQQIEICSTFSFLVVLKFDQSS